MCHKCSPPTSERTLTCNATPRICEGRVRLLQLNFDEQQGSERVTAAQRDEVRKLGQER